MLEAAFVTPLVLLLLFGVIDGGYGLHEKLSVDNMSLVGARSASGNGSDVQADRLVLQAIGKGAGGVATSQITSIVVYKAAGPSAVVPTACKTASVAAVCNRYTGADLAKATTEFGCVGPPGPVTKIDSFWCPTGAQDGPERGQRPARLRRGLRPGLAPQPHRCPGPRAHLLGRHRPAASSPDPHVMRTPPGGGGASGGRR